MSWHNTSHRMREGSDGPQIRGFTGGLLQKANRPAQDETPSSRLGEADTDLVEHVEHREPDGIIPELHPQDAALRRAPPSRPWAPASRVRRFSEPTERTSP